MSWDYADEESLSKKEELALLIEKRLSQLEEETGVSPVSLDAPKRGNICQSFWGREWCRHLEKFSAWEFRLPRGRSLLRKGAVYSPLIKEGCIHGYVAGEDLFETSIRISPITPEFRDTLKQMLSLSAVSLLDLFSGNLSDSLLNDLTCRENSLFPQPEEVQSICHCTDWADVCEHGAALLYAAGILFEQNPEQLFALRGVTHEMLVPETESRSGHSLPDERLEDIFGIEME